MIEIIAEIGANHEGNLGTALDLIRVAKRGGADVAKFQLYSSRHLFGDESRVRYEWSFTDVCKLFEMCSIVGIEFMASVFDHDRLMWCESLEVGRYKIASRTAGSNPDLCKSILDTGKPAIVSRGALDTGTSWSPFDWDVPHQDTVSILNCVSKYPTLPSDLRPHHFDFETAAGWSDHGLGIGACLLAVSRGATIVEKHLTLNKIVLGGIRDHVGSMDPEELSELRRMADDISVVIRSIAHDR